MTKPVKKIILLSVAVALVTVIVRDRFRVHEAEQVKADGEILKFAEKYPSPGESFGLEKRHGASINIIRLPLLPFIAREYRWTSEYRDPEITFKSKIVFYYPWDKYK